MDRYARSLARVAVAQIAEVAGFESVQESAADILADLLCRYQLTLCTDAQHLAELAGRTEMNLVDAFMALEDLTTTPDDLLQYLQLQPNREGDLPFAHTLPAFPVQQQRPWPPTFHDLKEIPPAHVPGFFPAFPDPHTYQHTTSFATQAQEPARARQTALKQKHAAQNAVVAQGSRIAAAAALDPSSNPFLQPPTEADGQEAGDAAAAILAGLPAPPAAGAGAAGKLLLQAAGQPAAAAVTEAAPAAAAGGTAAPGAVQAAFSGLLEAAGEQASASGWHSSSVGLAGDTATAAAAAAAAAAASSSGKGPPLAIQLAVVSRQLPAGFRRNQGADAYAAKRAQAGVGSSGKRSHRSKYDADPRLMTAESILDAPEEVNMPPPLAARSRVRGAAVEELFDMYDGDDMEDMED